MIQCITECPNVLWLVKTQVITFPAEQDMGIYIFKPSRDVGLDTENIGPDTEEVGLDTEPRRNYGIHADSIIERRRKRDFPRRVDYGLTKSR